MFTQPAGRGPANIEVASGTETLAFCERLRGYTYVDWDGFVNGGDGMDSTPLPPGYHNLRVFDGRDGRMMGSVWHRECGVTQIGDRYRVSATPPNANCVISICLSDFLEEVVEWRATRPLPNSESGVPNLVVDIETRPRQLFYDGTPLEARLVKWIAQKAPRRTDHADTSSTQLSGISRR